MHGSRPTTRRRVLASGAAVTALTVAGCSGDGGPEESDSPEETTDDSSPPPGADVLGGPNDLQSRADVDATVLETDEGAGRYVFTPAVVWLERGGTVVWHFEETDHTVTVYHDNYGRPTRIPDGVETPFSSEFGGTGTGHQFQLRLRYPWRVELLLQAPRGRGDGRPRHRGQPTGWPRGH
ncbi:MAG: hypothetical protein U5K37_02180 [Natrialbaceae archaeon]|nr:hypothetical protein [Natrialbaceae archaeon]